MTPRGHAGRRTAAALIRCMDTRDQAGADAILGRLRGRELDAVAAWVWRIEAERAYMASLAKWRAGHRTDLAEVIAVLDRMLSEPADGRSVRLAA